MLSILSRIFPSLDHKFLKYMIFFSFLRTSLHFFAKAKLSVKLTFFLFKCFILKTLHLVIYLANYIMIVWLLPLFLGAPSLCDWFILSFFISFPIFSFIIPITSSTVFLFLDFEDRELASSYSLSTVLVYRSFFLKVLLLQTYH